MTNKPNDGGPAWHPETGPNYPAFPLRGTDDYAGNPAKWTWLGLTKREYFAGLAMQALKDNYVAIYSHGYRVNIWKDVAEDAVAYADALLAELAK